MRLLIFFLALPFYQFAADVLPTDSLKRVYISGKFYKVDRRKVVPLQNSTVCIKGTRINSVSDSNGCYTLDVTVLSDTARALIVSGYLEGHEAQEFVVTRPFDTKVNFELREMQSAVLTTRKRN